MAKFILAFSLLVPLCFFLVDKAESQASNVDEDLEYVTQIARAAPILYYKLLEADGATSFLDSSSTGNDGSCSACPNMVPGQFDGGADFNGSSDYIDTASMVADPSATNLTALTWFFPHSVAGNALLIQQLDGTGTGRSWIFISTTSLLTSFLGGATTAGATTLVVNRWYHGGVVYDGSNFDIYLDGSQDGTRADTGEGATGICRFGSHKNLNSWYNGLQREIIIWNTNLVRGQIKKIYDYQRARLIYPFEEGIAFLKKGLPGQIRNPLLNT